jgi:O-antigen/teichoic acid export membrane protein
MINNKLLNNAKWIIVCKAIQSLIQLAVGMLSARYLGPSNYGLINYAAAIVAFVTPIMQLGLPGVLVREYVEQPQNEGAILGTALTMNMVSATVCIIGVTAFASVANAGEPTTILVCALYSTSLFFQAIEMVQYWFQAKLLSKYSSLAMLCSYVVVSAYKIYLLVTSKSVYWFALSHAVEYGVTGIFLLISYRKNGKQKLSFSADIARTMFTKSKYYIASSLMVVAFSSTASILMKLIAGTTENGYFSAAVTCTMVVQFVYAAIIDSARPVILESKKTSRKQFEKNVSRLYCVIVYLALAQSVVFTIFAELIIRILYGADYFASISVLQILIWQTAFFHMGAVRNVWILAEEKYSRLWIINLCGALVNIALNLFLIPLWGACGAAAASVLTQIVANFVIGFIMKDIRPNNRLMLTGLRPHFAWAMLWDFWKTIKADK